MNTKEITYLGAIIFLLIVEVILLLFYFYFKNKRSHQIYFKAQKSSESLWDFTKKHLLSFSMIFVMVLIISFVMLWISN
ncbi:hypothetical protein [Spiroplasma endosymbiont of Crioceris asparagi]|uniref:hypothetical protein n=1 Tax=Spiroplasma endosymbiont of Crioceris asparagi TaxID=3066286 RepID=UPI0030CD7973